MLGLKWKCPNSLTKSPSKTLPQDIFGDFENLTRGIGSRFMRKMGYDGHGMGRKGKGILIPFVSQ
jgi:hypothetical protein